MGLLTKISERVSDFSRATATLRAENPPCWGCGRQFNREKYGHECEYPGCTDLVCPRCRFCHSHGQCPDCERLFLVATGHACKDPYCDKLLCPGCDSYCKEHQGMPETYEEAGRFE